MKCNPVTHWRGPFKSSTSRFSVIVNYNSLTHFSLCLCMDIWMHNQITFHLDPTVTASFCVSVSYLKVLAEKKINSYRWRCSGQHLSLPQRRRSPRKRKVGSLGDPLWVSATRFSESKEPLTPKLQFEVKRVVERALVNSVRHLAHLSPLTTRDNSLALSFSSRCVHCPNYILPAVWIPVHLLLQSVNESIL